MKTTTRIAMFAAALLLGGALAAPITVTPAHAATKHHAAAHHKMHHKAGSASVKSLQDALNKQGASLTVDGKMGPKTRAALKSFQQAHGLKATGHVDKATKAALGM
ncbi:MAG TPA: peptidoglycan-binding domain-containing protein [Alphaproteobacteria bacterium]|nr:peptidoglycan-binding domain-containing protein [Alphaproteobacteria bacterium]